MAYTPQLLKAPKSPWMEPVLLTICLVMLVYGFAARITWEAVASDIIRPVWGLGLIILMSTIGLALFGLGNQLIASQQGKESPGSIFALMTASSVSTMLLALVIVFGLIPGVASEAGTIGSIPLTSLLGLALATALVSLAAIIVVSEGSAKAGGYSKPLTRKTAQQSMDGRRTAKTSNLKVKPERSFLREGLLLDRGKIAFYRAASYPFTILSGQPIPLVTAPEDVREAEQLAKEYRPYQKGMFWYFSYPLGVAGPFERQFEAVKKAQRTRKDLRIAAADHDNHTGALLRFVARVIAVASIGLLALVIAYPAKYGLGNWPKGAPQNMLTTFGASLVGLVTWWKLETDGEKDFVSIEGGDFLTGMTKPKIPFLPYFEITWKHDLSTGAWHRLSGTIMVFVSMLVLVPDILTVAAYMYAFELPPFPHAIALQIITFFGIVGLAWGLKLRRQGEIRFSEEARRVVMVEDGRLLYRPLERRND